MRRRKIIEIYLTDIAYKRECAHDFSQQYFIVLDTVHNHDCIIMQLYSKPKL